jgi:hypothetical protein
MKTVAGVFPVQTQAQQALQDLQTAGFAPQRVSVIARDTERARDVAEETGAEVPTGAAAGAGAGAVLGGLAGWLIGIGALAIPGIGPVVAAGPIAAALGVGGTTAAVGAGVGAVAGGLVGALTGWGFSESEAREYQERVGRGDILLAVEVPDDQDTGRAEDILRRSGGERVSTGTTDR